MSVRKPMVSTARRAPRQRRAHETVAAILQAVKRIVRGHGVKALSTNRIAEVAGVSVGSVYQYFPDKQAIYVALHAQHVEQSTQLLEQLAADYADAPLASFLRALTESLVDAHAHEPALYELLQREVPCADTDHGFHDRLGDALRLALSRRATPRLDDTRTEQVVFVAVHTLDALVHGSALARPPGLSLLAARAAAVEAVLVHFAS